MSGIKSTCIAFGAGAFLALLLLEAGLRISGFLQEQRRGGEELSSPRGKVCLCVGDSFTYGLGAASDKSYPHQLQELLDENTGEEWRVVNLGEPARNTTEIFDILRKNIDTVKPEIVVVLAGGANKWNYKGYGRYLQERTISARLCDFAYRLGVIKLIRLLLRDVSEKRAAPAHAVATTKRNEPYMDDLAFRGYRYRNELQYEKAIASFKKSIEMNPASGVSHVYLVQICEEMGKIDEAERYYSLSAALKTLGSWEYGALGDYNVRRGRYAEALSLYKRGVLTDPFNEENRCIMGLRVLCEKKQLSFLRGEIVAFLREARGRFGDANPFFEEALEQNGGKNHSRRIEAWMRNDIGKMIRLCRERKAAVVLQSYPGEGDPVFERIAEEYGVPFVDQTLRFETETGVRPKEHYFVPDRHCNAEGYGMMARNVFDTLVAEGLVRTEKDERIFSRTEVPGPASGI